MKHSRFLIAVSALALLAACTPTNSQVNDAASSSSAASQANEVTLQWQFEKVAGSEEANEPKVKASLVVKGGTADQTLDLGTYAGTEFTVPGNTEDIDPAPLTSASIWLPGGGDDLFVTRSADGTIVVSHRTVDEEAGIGPVKELGRVSAAVSVEVKVLGN